MLRKKKKKNPLCVEVFQKTDGNFFQNSLVL